jgi:hypothetical protein
MSLLLAAGTGGTTRNAVAADTLARSDSAIATSILVATANDTVSRTDSAVALQIAVADANDTLSRTDSATATSALVAVAADTISRTDAAVATSDLSAAATDTVTRTDAATATSDLVAAATDTLSRSDSAVAARTGAITAVAADTLSRSDSAVAINVPVFQMPTISGADPGPRRRKKDEREDLLDVIRGLSPSATAAERIVEAVKRSPDVKLRGTVGVATAAPVLALPESLRTIVRQAIKQVEDREDEELLLLL